VDKRSLWQRKALKGSRLRSLIWGVLAAFFLVVVFFQDLTRRLDAGCSVGWVQPSDSHASGRGGPGGLHSPYEFGRFLGPVSCHCPFSLSN